MNRRKLQTIIAKLESGKSNVKIGDIREIIKWLIVYEAAVDIVNKATKKKHRGPCTIIQMEANKLKKKKGFEAKAFLQMGVTKPA